MPAALERIRHDDDRTIAGKAGLDFPTRMVSGKVTLGSVTDQIAGIPVTHPHKLFWFVGFGLAFLGLGVFVVAVS